MYVKTAILQRCVSNHTMIRLTEDIGFQSDANPLTLLLYSFPRASRGECPTLEARLDLISRHHREIRFATAARAISAADYQAQS